LVDEYKTIPIENKTLDELECEAIKNALQNCNNNQADAASSLGITPRQIGYKIKKYGI